MQTLHKDLFYLYYQFIIMMLFKMQDCCTCNLYVGEGLEAGFALNLYSKWQREVSGKQEVCMECRIFYFRMLL